MFTGAGKIRMLINFQLLVIPLRMLEFTAEQFQRKAAFSKMLCGCYGSSLFSMQITSSGPVAPLPWCESWWIPKQWPSMAIPKRLMAPQPRWCCATASFRLGVARCARHCGAVALWPSAVADVRRSAGWRRWRSSGPARGELSNNGEGDGGWWRVSLNLCQKTGQIWGTWVFMWGLKQDDGKDFLVFMVDGCRGSDGTAS